VAEPTRAADPFLAAFTSEVDRSMLVDEFERARRAGGEVDYDLLDADTLHTLEPLLSEEVRVGIRIRGQRYLDPPRFVESLADSVRARGGTIVDGAEVVAVRDTGTGIEVVVAEGEA